MKINAKLAIKIIIVGLPALLLLSGWLAITFGTGTTGLGLGDLGSKGLGKALIIAGLSLYVLELLIYGFIEIFT